MPQDILCRVLRDVPLVRDENLIVGAETYDDAGVYKLSDELCLVQTVDVFTPVVDDPWWFGAVSAANSLSDPAKLMGILSPVLACPKSARS